MCPWSTTNFLIGIFSGGVLGTILSILDSEIIIGIVVLGTVILFMDYDISSFMGATVGLVLFMTNNEEKK